jgi:hypothetical protein
MRIDTHHCGIPLQKRGYRGGYRRGIPETLEKPAKRLYILYFIKLNIYIYGCGIPGIPLFSSITYTKLHVAMRMKDTGYLKMRMILYRSSGGNRGIPGQNSTFSNFINNITSIPMGDTAFLGGYRSK